MATKTAKTHEARASRGPQPRTLKLARAARSDSALDAIAATLSDEEWSPDTLDAVAAIIRATEREVRDL